MAKRLPTEPRFSDLESLRRGVSEADGETLICLGWELRLAGGESRLKEKARVRVEEALRGAGLVVIPAVPEDQKAEVFVTRAGSAVERLWLAFQAATPANLKLVLRSAGEAGRTDAEQDALGELRELLGEAVELADKAAGEKP